MDQSRGDDVEVIVAAAITGGFGLLATLVNRSAKRVSALNTQEHLLNKQVLERIEVKVDDLGGSFNEHLLWHLDSKGVA